MKHIASLCALMLSLTACSQGVQSVGNRTALPCGNKPNCVSTQDTREQHQLIPFILMSNVTMEQIEQAVLQLPRSNMAVKQDNYLRIECTSKFMRFIDDLEISINDGKLLVRSESRIGYSDFGVNRKRAEQLRKILKAGNLIQ